MSNRNRIITEEEVEKAIDWLRDSANDIGIARERLIKAQRMVDHIEALLFLKSDQTSDMKRKADARSDVKYVAAITEEAAAAGEFEKMKALREAAALKVEAWRTESATYRHIKVGS